MQHNNIYQTTSITVDSRSCGQGKTRGNINSIKSELQTKYNNKETSLVVLPSIHLIEEYIVIAEKIVECPTEYRAIHSENTSADSTTMQIANALANSTNKIILITQKAFKLSNWHPDTKKCINLFIDEALDPWDIVKVWHTEEANINFKWEENTTPRSPLDNGYLEIEVNPDMVNTSYTNNSTVLRDLTANNYKMFVNTEDYLTLCSNQQRTYSVSIIRELDDNLLMGWKTIRVAAAAFEHTFMRYWLDKNNLTWHTPTELQFQKHESPLTIHMPQSDSIIKWSLSKIQSKHPAKNDFKNYINKAVSKKDAVLYLRNNADSNIVYYGRNQEKASFNTHGLNKWRHINKVSIEAATNITPELFRYWSATVPALSGVDGRIRAYKARSGYDFYQLIMRSAARNNKAIDVYVLDHRVYLEGLNFFWSDNSIEKKLYEIPLTTLHYDKPKTKNKEEALTGAERAKINRYKKKHPNDCKGLSGRAVLSLIN
jgi:hypothetical protein